LNDPNAENAGGDASQQEGSVGGAGSQFMDQSNPANMSRSDLNDGGS